MKAEMFKSLGLHITFQVSMRSLILMWEVSESLEDIQTSPGERMIRWEWKSCNLNKKKENKNQRQGVSVFDAQEDEARLQNVCTEEEEKTLFLEL